MKDFFAVWDVAKDVFGLERKVHIDLEEAYIRITSNNTLRVKVDGTYDDTETMYQIAAIRLLNWVEQRTKQ